MSITETTAPSGTEVERRLVHIARRLCVAAICLVALLTLFGRGPRIAHWLFPLYIFDYETFRPIGMRILGGAHVSVIASWVIYLVLLRIGRQSKLRTHSRSSFDIGAAEAARRLALAGSHLQRLGFRQRPDIADSGETRWQRRSSWWSEDPRLTGQEVSLRVDANSLSVTHRLRSRFRTHGEEAYGEWLVNRLAQGEDFAAPPRTLLSNTVLCFALSLALLVIAALLAVAPIESPWWIYLGTGIVAIAVIVAAPLTLAVVWFERRVVLGGRLVAYSCALSLLSLVLLLQAPSSWEFVCDDSTEVFYGYTSALRDSYLNVVTSQLPLTSFELQAARRRTALERQIIDGSSDMAATLVDALPAASASLQPAIARLLERIGEPARSALHRAADHRDPAIRTVAAQLLRRLPNNFTTLDILARLLADPDRSVRLAAVTSPRLWLDRCADDGCLMERALADDVRERLSDPDPEVRRTAAAVLGKLGDKRAVSLLLAMLQSDTELSSSAIHTIDQIADPDSGARLTSLLEELVVTCGATSQDHARELVSSIAHTLAKLGESHIGPTLDLLGTPYEDEALSALTTLHARLELDLPQDILKRLLGLCQHRGDRVRRAALSILARARAPRAVATAIAALAGPDGFVVVSPLVARGLVPIAELARWAEADSPDIEAVALNRPLPRCATEIALGIVLNPRRSDDLRKNLVRELMKTTDTDLDPCWSEMVAGSDAIRFVPYLDALEPPLETGTLIALLASPWSTVRTAAAYSLGSRDEPQVVSQLLHLLDSPFDTDRDAAIEALGRLRARAAVPTLIRMLDELPNDLEDPDAGGNDAATLVEALGAIGDPAARPALRRFVRCPNAFRGILRGEVREPLGTYLAAVALGSTGDATVLPLLRSAIERPPWTRYSFDNTYNTVVNRVVKALGRLGEDGQHELSDILVIDLAVSPALQEIGQMRADGAFEILAKHLSDPRDEVRAAALTGLESLGDARAIALAVAAVEDREGWNVRATADVVSTLGHTDLGLRWYRTHGGFRVGFDEEQTRQAVRRWAIEHGVEVAKRQAATDVTTQD